MVVQKLILRNEKKKKNFIKVYISIREINERDPTYVNIFKQSLKNSWRIIIKKKTDIFIWIFYCIIV